MKLVQKILSHGLLIAFILAAIFGYTRREELFPQWFSRSVQTQRHTEKVTQEKTTPVAPQEPLSSPPGKSTESTGKPAIVQPDEPDEPVGDEASGAADVSGEVPSESADTVSVTQDDTVQDEVIEPEPVSAQEPAAKSGIPSVQEPVTAPEITVQVQTPVTDTPVQEDTLIAETPIEEVEPSPVEVVQEPALPAQAEESVAITAPGIDEQLQAQLAQARQYFWQRNLPAAEEIYHSLAESYPDNPDVWGEIGNFYFSLRKREPVIEAYSRSAELLIARGEALRAHQLVRILYRLGAPQARRLEMQLMQQAGG